MGTGKWAAAAVALALTVGHAGEARAQNRGGPCGGTGGQSAPGSRGTGSPMQSQLQAQMRTQMQMQMQMQMQQRAYAQQVQLAQLRAYYQQTQLAQLQAAQRAASQSSAGTAQLTPGTGYRR